MLILDIGCGGNKVRGALGVDRMQVPGVDHVCDFERDPLPFESSSVDVIHTRHTLEHIRDLNHLLREFMRVLKPDGKLIVTVPHFTCLLGYSDPTHVRAFGLYSFEYYSRKKSKHWRDTWSYTTDIWFTIQRKQLNFRNWSIFGPVITWLVNRNSLLQHIYESKFAWLIPCFEITYELQADKDPGTLT